MTVENSRPIQPARSLTERRTVRRNNNRNILGIFAAGALAVAAFEGGLLIKDNNSSSNGTDGPKATDSATASPVVSSSPEATATVNPTVAPSEVPSAMPTETPFATIAIDNAKLNADGTWALTNPDGDSEALQSVEGFIPDASLILGPEWGEAMPLNPEQFADFQASLNDPDHPLVGYTYGFNDESDNLNYTRTLQAPMFSWTVLTGEEVSVPGIGRLVGGPGRAVELMIMNIDGSVADFGPENPVFVKHGFIGTGRIWDGENVVEAERGISSHYVNRLQEGVTLPGESGFIGQCDIAENCNEVLVVAVIRTQWGFNEDGTKRFQYQLIRQELFSK